jgi:hypothetical protein
MDYNENIRSIGSDAQQPSREADLHATHLSASSLPPVLLHLGLGTGYAVSAMSEAQLLGELARPEWPRRVAALRRLEELGGCASPEPLLLALRDEHQAVRAAAAQALGACGDRVLVAALIPALHDPAWHVRASAVEALGKQGAQVPPEPLVEALRDEDEEVRAMAAWALGAMGERAPVAPLLAALRDPCWSVREAAALALGKLGARVPLAPLLAGRADEDDAVRTAVELAVQQTHPEYGTAQPHTEPLSLEAWKKTAAGDIRERPAAQTDPVASALPSDAHDPSAQLFTSSWRSLRSERTPAMRGESGRRQRQDHARQSGAEQIGCRGRGRLQDAAQPAKRRSLTVWMLERGLVAAVIIGFAFAWLLVGQGLHSQTSSHGHISTLFTYSDPAGAVEKVAWSLPTGGSDGRALIAFADVTGLVQVWDPANGQHIASYGPFPKVLAIGWAADGLRIASLGPDGMIQLRRGGENAPFLSIPGSRGTLPVAAWSPDGESIAIATNTGDGSTVQIWDIASQSVTATHSSQFGAVHVIAWPTTGKIIATANDDGNATQIEMWAADTGKSFIPPVPIPYTAVAFHVIAMAWSPDAEHLAYILADGEVRVGSKSTTTDSQFSSYDPGAYWSRDKSWAAALAWSADGKRLASTTATGLVLVWDVSSGNQLYSYNGHSGQINDLAWSQDGKWIVSAGTDGKVQVWGNV